MNMQCSFIMHHLCLCNRNKITINFACTCNERQVYFRDAFLLPMKRNDDTQGVPMDSGFRDQATLCTGDV